MKALFLLEQGVFGHLASCCFESLTKLTLSSLAVLTVLLPLSLSQYIARYRALACDVIAVSNSRKMILQS